MHPSRVRVKVCGITRHDDAQAAVSLGADVLGFVFWTGSSRFVDPNLARELIAALPPFVSTVGVFVNEAPNELVRIQRLVNFDYVQLHGDETPAYARALGMPFIKALRVRESANLDALVSTYDAAKAILLDTYVKGLPGGTGEAFNWDLVPARSSVPIMVAGGLNKDNVERAIRATRPWAVDVSGGVESSPGIKDPEKIAAFLQAAAKVGAMNKSREVERVSDH